MRLSMEQFKAVQRHKATQQAVHTARVAKRRARRHQDGEAMAQAHITETSAIEEARAVRRANAKARHAAVYSRRLQVISNRRVELGNDFRERYPDVFSPKLQGIQRAPRGTGRNNTRGVHPPLNGNLSRKQRSLFGDALARVSHRRVSA